ncbi:hypothetical protein CHS0354_013132 [Potamilus streckersoni]|uniref:Glutamyl-tRNA(Gln) amidotransferase subunit B, mitochondrial n=1 Tax=Potamilus streckersoni TaxID=2493646 RepID=A0AAE0S6L9_9BIVA|nr:hypothetical protein CHS0354_013132 [Potamilus streckersoni]
MKFEPVIGLEVHAQLATASKMFCSCPTVFGEDPNANTCPVCLGLPGALPKVNSRAVEFAVMLGMATHCTIRLDSVFARKNYFYPDLPKAYQTSQYDKPICENGYVDIELNGKNKRIGITRIHMEEDAGKLNHEGADPQLSYVDLNRAGIPLLEIVSEPDIRSPEEARLYMEKIHSIVTHLGVCNGDMEKGNLRCDANISLRPVGTTEMNTRTETKNLNSFRFVQQAIEYEIARQTDTILDGGKIHQETRLFDSERKLTYVMRTKENAEDYRYFPCPDLLTVSLSQERINDIAAHLPEMPEAKSKRFQQQYGLNTYDAGILVSDRHVSDFYEQITGKGIDPKKAANWMMGELFRLLNDKNITLVSSKITPDHMSGLLKLIDDNIISGNIAKSVLENIFDSGEDPSVYVERKGLRQVSDVGELEAVCRRIMADNPSQLAEYKSGKDKLFGFFVGLVMKETKGKANPPVKRYLRALGNYLGKQFIIDRVKNILTLLFSGTLIFFAGIIGIAAIIAINGFYLTDEQTKFANYAVYSSTLLFCAGIVIKFFADKNKKSFIKSHWIECLFVAVFFFYILPAIVSPYLTGNQDARFDWLTGLTDSFRSVSKGYFIAVQIFIIASFIPGFMRLNSRIMSKRVNINMMLLISFGFLIFSGALLLMLPRATVEPGSMPFVKALFMSASAVCVTGLSAIDIGKDLTFTGQLILLTLIQLGGIGIMTLTTLLSLMVGGGTGLREQANLKELLGDETLSAVRGTLLKITLFTFVIESIGIGIAYLLMPEFPAEGDKLFFTIFHVISAFCNAGFGLYAQSLNHPLFLQAPGIIVVLMVMIILGGLGFTVISECSQWFLSRTKRRLGLSLHAKMVLIVTVLLIVGGAAVIMLFEVSNSMKEMDTGSQLLHAFFHSVTPRTAGFNTIDMMSLSQVTIIFTMLLMCIGASPNSTGGGIKTTAFALSVLNLWRILTGQEKIRIFKSSVSLRTTDKAFAVLTLCGVYIIAFTVLVRWAELHSPDISSFDILFEVISALNTVGLSMGITAKLNDYSLLLLTASIKIAVIGSGNFGSVLTTLLINNGAEVMVIDSTMKNLDDVRRHATIAIEGDATDKSFLNSQNIMNFETVIVAVGEFEECLLIIAALQDVGVKDIIVRAKSSVHERIIRHMGIKNIIIPIDDAAEKLCQKLMMTGVIDSLKLSSEYTIIETQAGEGVLDKTLAEIKLRESYSVTLVTIKRKEERSMFGLFPKTVDIIIGVPLPDTIIKQGDILVIFGHDRDIRRFISETA